MHSFKFLPCKVGSLLTKVTHFLCQFFCPISQKKDHFPVSNFFPNFTLPLLKGDAWEKRERPLTFQNMIQEMLSNDANPGKKCHKKI